MFEAPPRAIRSVLALVYAAALLYQFIVVWDPGELFGAFAASIRAQLAADSATGPDAGSMLSMASEASESAMLQAQDYFWGSVITFTGTFVVAVDLVLQGAKASVWRTVRRLVALAIPPASLFLAGMSGENRLPFALLPESWLPLTLVVALPVVIAWLPEQRTRVFPIQRAWSPAQ
ncbi:hypothetical protein JD292_00785 [Leucobacter sp. CSA2]|uniref:Uncharacterized protein n=1 Tax=Leucobacter edaphi TaxID=2796472 RepID=A0A934Q9E1_9MICO|nr:hypothetical protein [Leucobacter edaphi]MBK0420615.1 hypothetical protein [Leucobacter edaphi]